MSSQELAFNAIEHIKTIPICMQEEFSILTMIFRVDQDIGLGGIPIVNIVGRELVVPFQFAGFGV